MGKIKIKTSKQIKEIRWNRPKVKSRGKKKVLKRKYRNENYVTS